ncbi:hypothetical protein PV327_008741 [Microctonus hyperodae]|uniref:DUF4806 domain-containing protein n=1 Tax=Microctonus hyperodae TaxID=165561 RepID=A0AA39KV13_MICHY|nr:hypothetical protein PV327_008741 [Microctonus hyperodae]
MKNVFKEKDCDEKFESAITDLKTSIPKQRTSTSDKKKIEIRGNNETTKKSQSIGHSDGMKKSSISKNLSTSSTVDDRSMQSAVPNKRQLIKLGKSKMRNIPKQVNIHESNARNRRKLKYKIVEKKLGITRSQKHAENNNLNLNVDSSSSAVDTDNAAFHSPSSDRSKSPDDLNLEKISKMVNHRNVTDENSVEKETQIYTDNELTTQSSPKIRFQNNRNESLRSPHEDSLTPAIDGRDFPMRNIPIIIDFQNTIENNEENDLKSIILNCYRKLSSQISTLQAEATRINLHMAHFKSHASTSSNFTSHLSNKRKFFEDNDLRNFPIIDMEKFEEFDEKLKTDPCVREEIEGIIWSLVDVREKLSKMITNIFIKFMDRDLILQFTAVKKTGNKRVFKETTFYASIRDTINTEYKMNKESTLLKEKQLHDAIGHVINCAKDWTGGRINREKKKLQRLNIQNDNNENSSE